jgi:hypothetical protein
VGDPGYYPGFTNDAQIHGEKHKAVVNGAVERYPTTRDYKGVEGPRVHCIRDCRSSSKKTLFKWENGK